MQNQSLTRLLRAPDLCFAGFRGGMSLKMLPTRSSRSERSQPAVMLSLGVPPTCAHRWDQGGFVPVCAQHFASSHHLSPALPVPTSELRSLVTQPADRFLMK